MKKFLAILLSLVLLQAYAMAGEIVVISREDGSGTRGAFVELSGVEIKNDEGKKIDRTVETAEIVNATAAVITSVEGMEASIAYVSLASLSDTVKALNIDGVMPSAENIRKHEYKLARPFNIVTKGDSLDDITKDFIDFILSEEGQNIVEKNGYIPLEEKSEYKQQKDMSGKITVGGSSSVTPLMEKLKEAYIAKYPSVEIEVQLSDSTTGIVSALDGVFTLGMASRALKDSEIEKGANAITIANDGIAIIVNKSNSIENITMEDLKNVYIGEITDWDTLQAN